MIQGLEPNSAWFSKPWKGPGRGRQALVRRTLPSTSPAPMAWVRLAERLHAQLACDRPGGHDVTVSISVAVCGEQARTGRALVEKADAALYEAKRLGKHRTVANPR